MSIPFQVEFLHIPYHIPKVLYYYIHVNTVVLKVNDESGVLINYALVSNVNFTDEGHIVADHKVLKNWYIEINTPLIAMKIHV